MPLRSVPVPPPIPVPPKQEEQPQRNNYLYYTAGLLLLLLFLLLLTLLIPKPAGTGEETSAQPGNNQAESDQGNNETDLLDSFLSQEPAAAGKPEKETESKTDSINLQESLTESPAESTSKTSSESISETTTETEPKNLLSQTKKLLSNLTAESANFPNAPQDGGQGFAQNAATVHFFGASGKGSKFVFVFDHSGSMSGSPLAALKRELIKALDPLNRHHSLNLIAYDDQFMPWSPKLVSANKQNKAAAVRFIEGINSSGGTAPRDALFFALGLKPDIIFFMTDGEFSLDLNEIAYKRGKTKINVVQFSNGAALPLLQDLAQIAQGSFVLLPAAIFSDAL